jgi:precorrin-6B methylase 2
MSLLQRFGKCVRGALAVRVQTIPQMTVFPWFRLVHLGACLLGGAIAAAAIHAQEPAGRYSSVPASPDGIGKMYMGREIAQTMAWQGAAWLERPEREEEERSDLLVPVLGVRSGMAVADVGAGSGYYTERLARAVGPDGVVYAVDVQPEMIAMLRERAQRGGLRNVQPVLGSVKDARLAPESLDLAIMVDVYHELEYPYEMLASLVTALKPGGRIVFVEFRAEDKRVPIKRLHKMSEAQIRTEAAQLPLHWARTVEDLPWQHVVIFAR